MCEEIDVVRQGKWRGWLTLPAADSAETYRYDTKWLDFSHPLSNRLARSPAFPAPKFERILSLPQDTCNLTRVEMVCHYGTHVDAPLHFIADGPAIHEIPLDRLQGPAVVWHFDKAELDLITVADFEAARPQVRSGDIVIIDTGWSRYIEDEKYHQHPYLTSDAAQWLVDHRVKLLAVDFATPDLPKSQRPTGERYPFPVHHILLSQGVLVAEHVYIPDGVAGTRVDANFAPINIEGADGAPARVTCRPLTSLKGGQQ